MTDSLAIRRPLPTELPRVAVLAADLVRMHHAVDPDRFLRVENVEEGYEWWFKREMKRSQAVILVATRGEEIIGYTYGTREGRDWNLLLDDHGAIHDIFVAAEHRRGGVAQKLLEAIIAELEKLGAKRIVLSTMVSNEAAQRVFRSCGFRPTMLEMTRSSKEPPTA